MPLPRKHNHRPLGHAAAVGRTACSFAHTPVVRIRAVHSLAANKVVDYTWVALAVNTLVVGMEMIVGIDVCRRQVARIVAVVLGLSGMFDSAVGKPSSRHRPL